MIAAIINSRPESTITVRGQELEIHWKKRHGGAFRCLPGWQANLRALDIAASDDGLYGPASFGSVQIRSALTLFRDATNSVERELIESKQWPRAVVFGASGEPFLPIREMESQTLAIIDALGRSRIDTWILTRGEMPPHLIRQIERKPGRFRVTIGLTTMDRDLQELTEPWAAPPHIRLRQLSRLRNAGVDVRIALLPLIPERTDSRENLPLLFEALRDSGIQHVTAGYRVTDPAIGPSDELNAAHDMGPIVRFRPGVRMRLLPKKTRQRGYARIMALAAEFGMTMSVCRISNPDFQSPIERPMTLERERLLFN